MLLAFFTLLQVAASSDLLKPSRISALFDSDTKAQLAKSPLHVVLEQSVHPSIIKAIVTNKADKTTFVSTLEGPLSHRYQEQKVYVYNDQDEPVNYIEDESSTLEDKISEYVALPAGSSISRDIDLTTKYDLQPGQQYFVHSGGFVPYYHEGQSGTESKTQQAIFDSNVITIKAPSVSNTAMRNSKAVLSPAAESYIDTGCQDPQMAKMLNQSIDGAVQMAMKTIDYVREGKDRSIMMTYFKADDEKTRKIIADRLAAVIKHLQTTTGPIRIGCAKTTSDLNYCKSYRALAVTEVNAGRTAFCPAAKAYPLTFKRCNDGNWAGSLIHELTHSRPLYSPNTIDYAQSPTQCKALTAAKALLNANTYNMVAQSVAYGKVC